MMGRESLISLGSDRMMAQPQGQVPDHRKMEPGQLSLQTDLRIQ
jgi:hypothetical protein